MKVDVLLGLQWGDEGKGKMSDIELLWDVQRKIEGNTICPQAITANDARKKIVRNRYFIRYICVYLDFVSKIRE